MEFRNFLEAANMVTRLAVFDFDSTLAKVPEKPEKHDKWHSWNGKDWWGSKESLSAPFYNMEMNDEVMEAMREAKNDPNTHTILLTGRRGVVSQHVRNVLRHHGLYGKRMIPDSNKDAQKHHRGNEHDSDDGHDSHEEYYSGDYRTEADYPKFGKKNKPAGDTLSHKIYVIKRLVGRLPALTKVEMWDDREDHFPHWTRLGKEVLRNSPVQEFFVHRVYNTASGTHYIQSVPVHNVKVY